jgi:hypothetical protein
VDPFAHNHIINAFTFWTASLSLQRTVTDIHRP